MSPSAGNAQCPFCLGRRRIKEDGTFYAHDRGRPGVMKRCPGTGRTLEQSRQLKAEGITTVLAADRRDAPAQVQPEDIF